MSDNGPGAPLTDAERVWIEEVGMRVRLARVRQRESQSELADRSGVSRVTIGSIERADHVAALISYRRLAEALDLPLMELLAPFDPSQSAPSLRLIEGGEHR